MPEHDKESMVALGAVLLGLAVGLYILFFCPTDCQ